MSGIVFFKTGILSEIKEFYIEQVGCRIWMDQGDCVILSHGNFLFGFCKRYDADIQGTITFFFCTKDDVDIMYEKLKSISSAKPELNQNYPIYNFFAKDPEGREIEFQSFTEPPGNYLTCDELLLTRRSIRQFEEKPVPQEVLESIFELSRYAPTSRNTQSYYFKLIDKKETLNWIGQTRGDNSAPIGRAPLAVAVCTDPEVSMRYIQDGCIAAYHFILAAWSFGLGTCWIAAMDRDDVKEVLKIPNNHYVATITPLGYPAGTIPEAPERKERFFFVKQ